VWLPSLSTCGECTACGGSGECFIVLVLREKIAVLVGAAPGEWFCIIMWRVHYLWGCRWVF